VCFHDLECASEQVRPFIVEVAAMHRSFGVVPIHWHVDANVPDRIIAAQVGIEQILANGLTNSCKFCTDEIAGWIRIHVKYYEDAGEPVSFQCCFCVFRQGVP
jgi:signal transduction histidine kinase